jgi:hypothetical protein
MTRCRLAICALVLAAAGLGGCTDPKHPTYACQADDSGRIGAPPPTAPTKDAAGDYTCAN